MRFFRNCCYKKHSSSAYLQHAGLKYFFPDLLLVRQVAAAGSNCQGNAQDFGGRQILQAERGGQDCGWQVCNN